MAQFWATIALGAVGVALTVATAIISGTRPAAKVIGKCSICKRNLKDYPVKQLSCACKFHKQCISELISEGGERCPQCKSIIL